MSVSEYWRTYFFYTLFFESFTRGFNKGKVYFKRSWQFSNKEKVCAECFHQAILDFFYLLIAWLRKTFTSTTFSLPMSREYSQGQEIAIENDSLFKRESCYFLRNILHSRTLVIFKENGWSIRSLQSKRNKSKLLINIFFSNHNEFIFSSKS